MTRFVLTLDDAGDRLVGTFAFDPPVDLDAQARPHAGSGAQALGIAAVDYIRFRLGDDPFTEAQS